MLPSKELEQIYLRHCRMVWNICYPFFMNPQDTEDAAQETFLRLAQSDEIFETEDNEKAWLIVTARNVCRNELRRARRTERSLEEAPEPTLEVPVPDETLLALSRLPEKYRTVLYLYYYEGLETEAIARLLGKRASTVRSDLHRGRQKFKALLGGVRP